MSRNQFVFDCYADSVIGDRPADFDAIEVQGVRGSATDPETAEVDNYHPDFFSVYLHYKEGNIGLHEGVQCAGDFTRRADALKYANRLHAQHGWPIHDYSKDAPPLRAWEKMTDELLLEAAKRNDLENAFLFVMEECGISDNSLAHQALSRYFSSWNGLTASLRVQALECWREDERKENRDYAPSAPENIHLTLVLAGLRLLQRNLTELPEPIIDLLAQDHVSIETLADRTHLEKEIDKVCEMTNDALTDGTDEVIEALRTVLPYAQTRAEDMTEGAISVEAKIAAADAWEAVNKAHELLGTAA